LSQRWHVGKHTNMRSFHKRSASPRIKTGTSCGAQRSAAQRMTVRPRSRRSRMTGARARSCTRAEFSCRRRRRLCGLRSAVHPFGVLGRETHVVVAGPVRVPPSRSRGPAPSVGVGPDRIDPRASRIPERAALAESEEVGDRIIGLENPGSICTPAPSQITLLKITSTARRGYPRSASRSCEDSLGHCESLV